MLPSILSFPRFWRPCGPIPCRGSYAAEGYIPGQADIELRLYMTQLFLCDQVGWSQSLEVKLILRGDFSSGTVQVRVVEAFWAEAASDLAQDGRFTGGNCAV